MRLSHAHVQLVARLLTKLFLSLFGFAYPAWAAAQTPIPAAQFFTAGGPWSAEDCRVSFQVSEVPFQVVCTRADRVISATTRGDREPEAQYRISVNQGPPEPSGKAVVVYYLRVVPNGTDLFGELASVPLRMPWRVSLIAGTNNGRAFAQTTLELRGVDFPSFFVLLDYRACVLIGPPTPFFCADGNNQFVTQEGVLRFQILGSSRYEMSAAALASTNSIGATPITALLSAWIDPLPELDDGIDPIELDRPPGWRLSEHYRLEFSPNILRTPCEFFCDDFE